MQHLTITLDEIELHAACQGEGPLVIFCHGFPGLWYSWRHQLNAVAEAGFRALALDMRGYGRSDRPAAVDRYSYDALTADLLGTMAQLGAERAIIVGHDFGANLAWHFAARHPEKTQAVAALSVPYGMDLAGGSERKPSEIFAEIARKHFFHMHYFQQPGVAEQEFRGREQELLTKLFWALSARGNLLDWTRFPSQGTGYLDVLAEPELALPWPWLSREDRDYYVREYLRAGPDKAFTGGLNAYRALDINWAINRPYERKAIALPALFITGAADPVMELGGEAAMADMQSLLRDLRGLHIVPDAGHFVQQEQAEAVNHHLLAFLDSLR